MAWPGLSSGNTKKNASIATGTKRKGDALFCTSKSCAYHSSPCSTQTPPPPPIFLPSYEKNVYFLSDSPFLKKYLRRPFRTRLATGGERGPEVCRTELFRSREFVKKKKTPLKKKIPAQRPVPGVSFEGGLEAGGWWFPAARKIPHENVCTQSALLEMACSALR